MKELLFQKIWEGYCFDSRSLKTTCGQHIELLHTGRLNTGDGPDFSQASIIADRLFRMFGHIELHIRCRDWYAHGHHRDPRYNAVILHVVLREEQAAPVQRADGTFVPTLVLAPHLSENWRQFIRTVQAGQTLRCAGIIRDLKPDILTRQLAEASELYFQEKRRFLLQFYNENVPVSRAWLDMLFLGWCDGLGIPSNREMLTRTGRYILQLHHEKLSTKDILREAMWYTGLTKISSASRHRHHPLSRVEWDLSSCRPGNDPILRVRQSVNFLNMLHSHGFGAFLSLPEQTLLDIVDQQEFGGSQRRQILRQIVLLPALHVLGSLMHIPRLQQFANHYWQNGHIPTPKSHLRMLHAAGNHQNVAKNHPGTIHQIKRFCEPGNCTDCLVFKSATGG